VVTVGDVISDLSGHHSDDLRALLSAFRAMRRQTFRREERRVLHGKIDQIEGELLRRDLDALIRHSCDNCDGVDPATCAANPSPIPPPTKTAATWK
jgi:hypothetical protein